MGYVLAFAGLVVYVAGGLFLIIKAFRVSLGWGLATLFVPFAALVFVFKHWEETKRPFLAGIGGFVLIVMGAAILPDTKKDPAPVAAKPATEQQATYASAAAPPAYTPPASSYPAAAPAPAPVASAPEQEPKRLAQVYIDRTTRTYYAEDCKTRPEETTRVARSVAVMQGFTAAKCPPKKRR